MRAWMLLVALVVCNSGCKSVSHPPVEKEPVPELGTRAPNAEAAPWAQ